MCLFDAAPHVFTSNDMAIQQVATFRYLGLHFSESGAVEHLITPLKPKMAASWAAVQRSHAQLMCADTVNVKLGLLRSILVPTVHYGCEVWGLHSPRAAAAKRARSRLQSLYERYSKIICGVQPSTPNAMLLAELGLFPLLSRLLICGLFSVSRIRWVSSISH